MVKVFSGVKLISGVTSIDELINTGEETVNNAVKKLVIEKLENLGASVYGAREVPGSNANPDSGLLVVTNSDIDLEKVKEIISYHRVTNEGSAERFL